MSSSSVFWGCVSVLLHFELIGWFSLIDANEQPQLRLSVSTPSCCCGGGGGKNEEPSSETRTDGAQNESSALFTSPRMPADSDDDDDDDGDCASFLLAHLKTWRGRRRRGWVEDKFFCCCCCLVLILKTSETLCETKKWRWWGSSSLKCECCHERKRHGSAVEDPRSPQFRLLQRFIVDEVSRGSIHLYLIGYHDSPQIFTRSWNNELERVFRTRFFLLFAQNLPLWINTNPHCNGNHH